AAPYPAIEDHFDPVPHGIDDLGELIERRPATVELAAAVVGDHDRVAADVGRAAGIGYRHHALEHELAAPIVAQLLGRLPVHRLVEHLAEIGLDRHRDVAAGGDVFLEVGQREL